MKTKFFVTVLFLSCLISSNTFSQTNSANCWGSSGYFACEAYSYDGTYTGASTGVTNFYINTSTTVSLGTFYLSWALPNSAAWVNAEANWDLGPWGASWEGGEPWGCESTSGCNYYTQYDSYSVSVDPGDLYMAAAAQGAECAVVVQW